MSRRDKPRKHAQSPNLAWPIIIFGVILIAAAGFLLMRQRNAGATPTITVEQTAGAALATTVDQDTSGAPRVAVDPESIDYGYVKFDELRAFEIAVTNAGTGVLRFGEKPYIEILEGC